ncbi:P-loop containing nucleoside triphosphate hydrolase protein [Emericellopsis atlantica]|uniref:P-loop containing nucleoside triphosphate hydrolase protein n=1 Tax=Emericellopsis atlantica TaxID=2614577 RepID=A0A9P7ZMA6_9HYPO|nr:P-loop containing nucleoside triphosphate hydrolase protein [Emericellopsis atlantica]KAG9254327.1 P-loop containing nucleoside triphosphate hydrolase protein [Emericellopsis atlantica]
MASNPPPAPPPPPPRAIRSPRQDDGSQHGSSQPFILHGEGTGNMEFEFPKSRDASGSVSLRTVVGSYLGAPQSAKATADKVFQILGRLRCLRHALERYNDGLATQSAAFLQYWRRHTLDLLSGFGFYAGQAVAPIRVAGLDEIIRQVEAIHERPIQEARDTIKNGKITFDGLGELFRPERHVKASMISGSEAPCVFRVTDAYYEERRSLFGSQKQFRVTLEAVVSMGDHFSVASFSEVMLTWSGARARPLDDFTYSPVSDGEHEALLARAARAVGYGAGGAKYLAYSPDSFFLHTSRARHEGQAMSQSTNSSQTLIGGRIMVDMARGASMGHSPCQGVDEATLSIVQLAGRYRQWLSKRSQSSRLETPETESLFIWDQVPQEFLITCWPALVGFSFTAKIWGHVLVDGLSHIDFQDQAYDRLVLSQERKQLIRAVVRCGTTTQTQDLISGKQGGLIFLLHGPPGVGKTLTAEAVAEVLHRPLYYITMGELGVTPDELEKRLTDVLDLCAEWDALAVLDEADVFLETRSNADLVRNAMVCVMLRILEYHPGILFLTTNRVRNLDPAFESRITLAIRYESLDRDARLRVWESQLANLPGPVASDIDCAALAAQQLNGRQIKNTMRLALSLATDQGVALTQSTLLNTIEVTTLGTRSMGEDSTWEAAVDDRNRRR